MVLAVVTLFQAGREACPFRVSPSFLLELTRLFRARVVRPALHVTLLSLRPRIQPLVDRSSVDLLYFVFCRSGRRLSDHLLAQDWLHGNEGTIVCRMSVPVRCRASSSPQSPFATCVSSHSIPSTHLSYGAALGHSDLALSFSCLSLAMREIGPLVTPCDFRLRPSSPLVTSVCSLRLAFARTVHSMSDGFKTTFILGPFGVANVSFWTV